MEKCVAAAMPNQIESCKYTAENKKNCKYITQRKRTFRCVPIAWSFLVFTVVMNNVTEQGLDATHLFYFINSSIALSASLEM